MSDYFLPDRSDRPQGEEDRWSKTIEMLPDTTAHGELPDGRPFLRESTSVDGFWIDWYYFDIRGLENATVEELRRMIETALGHPVFTTIPDEFISCWATRKQDAQGRGIWELAAMDMRGD